MLKFCLTCDTEDYISFKQGNPTWNNFQKFKGRINNLIKNLRYNKDGFKIVYKTIMDEQFPITFMIVGKLFKPFSSPEFIEWGYHTYSHIPLTLIDDNKVKEQVKNIFNCVSFCAPMWMIEDERNPDRIFKILEKENYKNIIYRGTNLGKINNHYFNIGQPIKNGKINLVHISNVFEGNSSKKHIKYLKREIINNIDKEGIYCLSMHDFTHKNNKNLLSIIKFVKYLGNKNKIKIINVKDVK